ncbi:hypothetical protein KBZ18_05505 [Synechococcus sp. Cruz-9H2]|uniref:hypothetical protein n=1 Tax=unclassified Synechococcus TaxID=2626047 RepID=UPI0020CCD708|nr:MULTISPECIES: hypothetical protein [unclassified Synechococcus]MCP9818946.1 hypothetical protein [Synechococcus sp. Cruz-9H2]MCP9843450.1 hypothetical protein [Synechococcus sp. Edmonson 11F2]MCP9855168.1 hypothetical protein [Synechococcus sp. Cruz-9C9]MCP9869856.1 hypothetical protein [Synechococcus sp. Cruz-7B9]
MSDSKPNKQACHKERNQRQVYIAQARPLKVAMMQEIAFVIPLLSILELPIVALSINQEVIIVHLRKTVTRTVLISHQ